MNIILIINIILKKEITLKILQLPMSQKNLNVQHKINLNLS